MNNKLTQCDRCGGRFVSKDCYPIIDEIMVCVSCRQAMGLQAELSANEQTYAKVDNLLIERNRELGEVITKIERLHRTYNDCEKQLCEIADVFKKDARHAPVNNKTIAGMVKFEVAKLKSLFGEIFRALKLDRIVIEAYSPEETYAVRFDRLEQIFESKCKAAGIELEERNVNSQKP